MRRRRGAAATTGGLQSQRTYFRVRSRNSWGSRTWKRMKKGLKPSAFSSAARFRADRAFARSAEVLLARRLLDEVDACGASPRTPRPASARSCRPGRAPGSRRGSRCGGPSPVEELDQAPLGLVEVVVGRRDRILDDPTAPRPSGPERRMTRSLRSAGRSPGGAVTGGERGGAPPRAARRRSGGRGGRRRLTAGAARSCSTGSAPVGGRAP